jgi:hypothetical protein
MVTDRHVNRSLLAALAMAFSLGPLASSPPARAATAAHACGVPGPGYKTIEEEGHEPPVYNLTGTLLMGYVNPQGEREPTSATVPVAEMSMGTPGTFTSTGTFEGSEENFRGIENGTSFELESATHPWHANFSDLCMQSNGHVGGTGNSVPGGPNHEPNYWLELIPPPSVAAPAPPAPVPAPKPSVVSPKSTRAVATVSSSRVGRLRFVVTIACRSKSRCPVGLSLSTRSQGVRVLLARANRVLRPGQTRRIMLAVARRARRQLRRHPHLRLTLTVDSAGSRLLDRSVTASRLL